MIQTSFRSHLTILETSVSIFASRAAFRTPQIAEATGKVERWGTITYQEFYDDVERVAKYWFKTLGTANIPPRAVVGIWLTGLSYSDVVQIYGVSRAGYVPQLFSLILSNSDSIFELLEKGNGQALIYEPSFEVDPDKSPIPLYTPPDPNSLRGVDHEPLPRLTPIINGDDIVLIFHTSGSTSGVPKLVPCSYKWLDHLTRKSGKMEKPRDPNHIDVAAWVGSTCHLGQTFMFLSTFQYGACMIQPTKITFSSEELADMIERCGLNRLTQFPTYLGVHLRNSYSDPKLLDLLQSLEEVLYSGMPLGKEEEIWAYKNGIRLKSVFASTECGSMLSSIGGQGRNASLLRPLEGFSYAFIPVNPVPSKLDSEGTGVMLELVVLSDSGDCPHPSLRSPKDGHFHTGDLFEEVAPGCYVSRGRDDDWIKSEYAGSCDTKSIEDNVRSTCPDLVAECIVVGNRRPSPALFVEPLGDDIDPEKLKTDILQRIHEFHARRYIHERIKSVDMIIIVDRGALPRTATKGNIRRRAVEETFKEKLDEAYGTPLIY